MTQGPATFQMGVPAIETFPSTLLARLRANAIRVEVNAPPFYLDPRGELELRREIAAYLAVARGINCSASQVINERVRRRAWSDLERGQSARA